jgi:hypothetical protein
MPTIGRISKETTRRESAQPIVSGAASGTVSRMLIAKTGDLIDSVPETVVWHRTVSDVDCVPTA